MTIDLAQVIELDKEIAITMAQIQACLPLPPEKRALATTRAHRMLGALEKVRERLTNDILPETIGELAPA